MRNFPGILQNSKLKTLQKFLKITRTKISQPPYVLWSEGVGGEPEQPWRTLRANAGCALFVFLLYRFPLCHLLILWFTCTVRVSGGVERGKGVSTQDP